jgi:hypothetical protein
LRVREAAGPSQHWRNTGANGAELRNFAGRFLAYFLADFLADLLAD